MCCTSCAPQTPHAPAAAGPATPPAAAGPSAHVLVVDDEPELAELLRELLEGAGYAVRTAASGAEALALAQQQAFDLVVNDLRMPGTDGLALWQALQRQQPALARRLLVVTGDTLNPAVQRFAADTGCPLLDKPFSRRDLLRALQALQNQPAPGTA